jgi:hypothetical protein
MAHNGMRRCEQCGTNVPHKNWQQHIKGRHHQSIRFYGETGYDVKPIRLYQPDGTFEREVRPSKVPERIAGLARRGRELILASKHLVAHSGVALFQRACLGLSAEALCAALFRLEEHNDLRAPCPRLVVHDATVARVAAAAALVDNNVLGTSEICDVSLTVAAGQAHDAADEAALGAALTALAEALGRLRRGGQRVELHLGAALVERRCINLLVRQLERALLAATGLVALAVSASPGSWREADTARVEEAAWRGWRARELMVLRGTHGRGDSPFRVLPAAIVRHILELVACSCRARVSVSVVAAAQTAPPSVGGADMDAIAAMLVD